ncbi:MAG: DUF3810 domain-containing protein [Urechidicola sp.]|nr:DUF3810 domain-containing protein [Urechidicola sp.]
MKNKKLNLFLAILLPIQWLLVQFISSNPAFIETYYSLGIYPYIARFSRIIFGWLPFSIGDILYILLGVLIIKSIIKIIKTRKIRLLKIISNISIIYFFFHLLWGFNYFREPLQKSLQISSTDYTTEELEVFTQQLINKVNHLQIIITHNDTLKVEIPHSKKDIYNKAENGYSKLSQEFPHFDYKSPSIKNSLISLPLTYMGFSGYLNPFTGEAQVNSLNPMVSYPVTSCHEVAHQLGYAAENEANFIGFLAAVNNEDIYFQYSGYYLTLRYALNDLYGHDKEKYKATFESINPGIIKNMRESHKFWNSYQNPFEVYFKQLFNQFLKVNKQPEGIKSYNRMVGMLINYNQQHPFLEPN